MDSYRKTVIRVTSIKIVPYMNNFSKCPVVTVDYFSKIFKKDSDKKNS